MKATMSNKDADQRLAGLRKLESSDVVLPVAVGYRILKNIQQLDEKLQPYHTAVSKSVEKHSHGKMELTLADAPEAYRACVAEIGELGQIEIEVAYDTIPLKAVESISLSMDVLNAVSFMIEAEESDG